MEISIEDFVKILIDAGWCKVFHQSTEYLIIGTFIIPRIVIINVALKILSLSSKTLQAKRYNKYFTERFSWCLKLYYQANW